LIGFTEVDEAGLKAYLDHTDQLDFLESYNEAREGGLSPAECLISFYAKLCYKSLTLGKNDNVTRIREIQANIENCFATGHGSVFEHVWFNFVTTNCSRVMTHELVRHRIGVAYSQTSGRYCRLDKLDFVSDPLLKPVEKTLREMITDFEVAYLELCEEVGLNEPGLDFGKKKKLTSALRRMAPNGQANEIGWSCNVRALRHLLMMRTSRHAEREIRRVFNQVYELIKDRYPMLVADAVEEEIDGLLEIRGMKMQQYDVRIADVSEEVLIAELERRHPEIGYGV